MDFMERNEPNFIWKNANALKDKGLIIENEIMELSANKRYETITVPGRNGELHETSGDYDSYDLTINDVSIPFDNLYSVKQWLAGRSKLVTHNDIDKYRDCICTMSKPIEFKNEIGYFYSFNITFRCQPFRKQVNDIPIEFKTNNLSYHDNGQEKASPYIELVSSGGDVKIKLNSTTLTLTDTSAGFLYVDNEKGMVIQNSKLIMTKGDWLKSNPGMNKIEVSSNASSIKLFRRSVWL